MAGYDAGVHGVDVNNQHHDGGGGASGSGGGIGVEGADATVYSNSVPLNLANPIYGVTLRA
eukprot:364584-Chlamydomonas_euryale.AAC.14